VSDGALHVSALAAQIHSVWTRHRAQSGWALGPSDPNARTSPYLKPVNRFSPAEWRRERWLALTDLLAIADEPQIDLARMTLSASAVTRLQRPFNEDDVGAIAQRTHRHCRPNKVAFGYADPPTPRSFGQLDARARALACANVRCDISAIKALVDRRVGPLDVVACADMAEHAALLRDTC